MDGRMPLFRAPMRSRLSDVEDGAATDRALRMGLCGIGGVLNPAPQNLDDAVESARTQYDRRAADRIKRFAQAPGGALVWTRDVDGLFWLGRLIGSWGYDDSRGAVAVDLVHVRACNWVESPVDEQVVPAGVLSSFARGGKNWQTIRQQDAADGSAGLWLSLTR